MIWGLLYYFLLAWVIGWLISKTNVSDYLDDHESAIFFGGVLWPAALPVIAAVLLFNWIMEVNSLVEKSKREND